MLLSAHADDVALSLGGLLQRDLIPRPITLVTVFGRSSYSRTEGFAADWRLNTQRRLQEDTAYAESLGLKLKYLDLAEACLDPVRAGRRLFTSPRGLEVPAEVSRMIEAEFRTGDHGSVWIPFGLGGHRDHLLVEKAATKIGRARKLECFYYEDLPYAAAILERAIRRRAASISRSLRPILVDIGLVLEKKIEALRLYDSQIGEDEITALRKHHRRWNPAKPMERLWSSC